MRHHAALLERAGGPYERELRRDDESALYEYAESIPVEVWDSRGMDIVRLDSDDRYVRSAAPMTDQESAA